LLWRIKPAAYLMRFFMIIRNNGSFLMKFAALTKEFSSINRILFMYLNIKGGLNDTE
jgi:hypothetical protein